MNNEKTEISGFVKILLAVLIFIGLVYIFTNKVVEKKTTTTPEEKVTYNEIIVSTILKQNEEEYYVLLYNSKGDKKEYYNELQDKYITNTKTPKLYYVDLNNILNESVVTEDKTNLMVTDITELKATDGTLLTIKENKIEKSYVGYEDVLKTLGL